MNLTDKGNFEEMENPILPIDYFTKSKVNSIKFKKGCGNWKLLTLAIINFQFQITIGIKKLSCDTFCKGSQ